MITDTIDKVLVLRFGRASYPVSLLLDDVVCFFYPLFQGFPHPSCIAMVYDLNCVFYLLFLRFRFVNRRGRFLSSQASHLQILILRTLQFARVRVVECEMGSEATLPKWASEPCIMGIDVPYSRFSSSSSYFSFSLLELISVIFQDPWCMDACTVLAPTRPLSPP